jgi:hypothetical protein
LFAHAVLYSPPVYQGHGAVEMVVGVELYARKAGIAGADEQYFINVIAVGKRVFEGGPCHYL